MFAVYRTDSDNYTYSSDTVLFVTADMQMAKDSVTLAELELKAALAVDRPDFNSDLVTALQRRGAYSQEISDIFTVDLLLAQDSYFYVNQITYYYSKVEVR